MDQLREILNIMPKSVPKKYISDKEPYRGLPFVISTHSKRPVSQVNNRPHLNRQQNMVVTAKKQI
jgi:hypothetical protein